MLPDRLRALGFRVFRGLLSLRRRGAVTNADVLAGRGETLAQLSLREAVADDISSLAALHVTAWNDAYAPLMTGPPVSVREQQWRQAFAKPDDWFCSVLQRPDGRLVGFTKGVIRPDGEFRGELNKLFLAREYQRLGLGRRLVGNVVQRFLAEGITSLSAYVDPRNPSCGFFERLGGEWLIEPDGQVNVNWYIWRDLPALARYCLGAGKP